MIIPLDASATVRTVDAVRMAILSAFDQDSLIEIDASAVAEIDLSLVQLIEAARVHAARTDKVLRLKAPANPALVALLRRAGFLNDPHADIDFWCHGELPQ